MACKKRNRHLDGLCQRENDGCWVKFVKIITSLLYKLARKRYSDSETTSWFYKLVEDDSKNGGAGLKPTQLLKGVLDGCVLQIISEKEIYGYELVQTLKQAGFTTIVGGTVYPLLQKLEKQELIKGELKPSPDGPDRKYFTITEAGVEYLAAFQLQWRELVETVERINGEGRGSK